jgi:hypothetical protein
VAPASRLCFSKEPKQSLGEQSGIPKQELGNEKKKLIAYSLQLIANSLRPRPSTPSSF